MDDSQSESDHVLFWSFLIAVVMGALVLRHHVALVAWNGNLPLGSILVVVAIAQLLLIAVVRPTSRPGWVMLALATLPIAGLALTQLAIMCCPGGHPPLGGLLWSLTGQLTVPSVIGSGIAVVHAARAGEKRLFIGGQTTVMAISAAVATALLPLPF